MDAQKITVKLDIDTTEAEAKIKLLEDRVARLVAQNLQIDQSAIDVLRIMNESLKKIASHFDSVGSGMVRARPL